MFLRFFSRVFESPKQNTAGIERGFSACKSLQLSKKLPTEYDRSLTESRYFFPQFTKKRRPRFGKFLQKAHKVCSLSSPQNSFKNKALNNPSWEKKKKNFGKGDKTRRKKTCQTNFEKVPASLFSKKKTTIFGSFRTLPCFCRMRPIPSSCFSPGWIFGS